MIPETNETRRDLVFEDHQIPVGRIKVYDTRFTVPSNGMVYRIYDLGMFPNNSPVLADPYYSTDDPVYNEVLYGDVDGGARSHMIFEDWETGVAPAVSGDYFATVHEGYFYARESGTYLFKMDYIGGLEFYFDTDTAHGFTSYGARTKHNIESLSPEHQDWAKTGETVDSIVGSNAYSTVTLVAGEFYKFRLKYWNKYRVNSSVVLSFSAPSSDGTDFIPFSAGNCSDHFYKASENDYFLEPINISSVTSMTGSRRETDAAAYNFTIRMTDTQSQNKYNPATDTFGVIKKDMLVKFQMGYSTSDYGEAASDGDYITRFTGFITSDVHVDRDKFGAYAIFGCHDFKNRLVSAHNLNYPNTASYLFNSFYDIETDSGPDGFHKVRFFDRWPLKTAIKTLLLLGGIDPQLMNQKYRALTVDGDIQDTTLDTIHTQDIRLDAHDNYAVNYEGYVWPKDYKPLWSFKFATDSVNDILNELAKNYGFRFTFSVDGIPYVTSIDYYDFVARPDSYNEDNLVHDKGASNYEYLKLSNGENAYYSFYGRRADVIARRSSLDGGFRLYKRSYVNGAWTDFQQIYSVYMDGENVVSSSGVFLLNFRQKWHVRDGVYAPVSSNPCIINPNATSEYGLHTYWIQGVGDDIYIDGIRSYVFDNYTPVRNYNTSNLITSLTVLDNVKDMINEVFVIGESSTSVASDSDVATHIPAKHVFHRAIDVRSQLDPDYRYYRGRKIPVIINEPKITQVERAAWLAEATLERYRTNALMGTFSGVGDPFIEVFDPITVDDIKTEVITDNKVLWVIGFNESLSKGNYSLSNVETTPRPPIPSFIKQSSISEFISDNFPEKTVAFEDMFFSGSHTSAELAGEYGTDSYGTTPYGGGGYNFTGVDFSNRIHFKPYEARENGDVAVISWSLLKRGRQYLEIWDTQSDDNISFNDPYVAASSDTNINCTASDFESHESQGKLISVVYLNREGVPDEPGNYSVTWDGIYESIDKSDPKWANQSRYYEIGNGPVLDHAGPSGAGVFAMPYFDTTGGQLAVDNWPHRTRSNCVFFPLRIKHVFVNEDGSKTEYWFGSQRLNQGLTDFTSSFPFYIHTFQIPPRFDIDFDFVRVKEGSSGNYEVMDDLYVDNWWTRETVYDSTDLNTDSRYSHNHPKYGTQDPPILDSTTRQLLYVDDPTHYNRSKFVNVTSDEGHKFGIYLTCSRPNQRIQVVDSYLGYAITSLYRGQKTRREMDEDHDGAPESRSLIRATDLDEFWFMTTSYSGDFSLVSADKFGGESVGEITKSRFFDVTQVGYNNPFSVNYGFRRFDSTYNLTSPVSDLRNVFVIDLNYGSNSYTPLFSKLEIMGNPPLDSRYLFNPSWQGSYNATDDGLPYSKKFAVPLDLMGDTIDPGGPFDFPDMFYEPMTLYQKRKGEADYGGTYLSPKSFSETFYNLCTLDRNVRAGAFSNPDLYGNPNDYIDIYSYYSRKLPAVHQDDTKDYLYSIFSDPEYCKMYSSYRLVLHMHLVDEGGRVYRIVDGGDLNLGQGWDINIATLPHSYSNVNRHMLDECSLLIANPDSTYLSVGSEFYDRYPTAIIGRANLSGPTDSGCKFFYDMGIDADSAIMFYNRFNDFDTFIPNFDKRSLRSRTESIGNNVVFSRSWAGHTKVLNDVEYNVPSYGDLNRSVAASTDATQGIDLFTLRPIYYSMFGERFFPVHDYNLGVDVADVDVDFDQYRNPPPQES